MHHMPAVGLSRTRADLGFLSTRTGSDLSASHPQAEPPATLCKAERGQSRHALENKMLVQNHVLPKFSELLRKCVKKGVYNRIADTGTA